jgi:hypothetical protein
MVVLTVSTALLVVFAVLAAVDGIYIHLVRLRLPSRPQSWMEHVWHSISALLFVPILLTIHLAPTSGLVLWLGVALIAVLYWVEVRDLREERASRADLGGLSRRELALHVVLVVSRSLSVVLALASRPAAAWSPFAGTSLAAHPAWITNTVGVLVPSAAAVALVHVYFAWKHRPAGCCALEA